MLEVSHLGVMKEGGQAGTSRATYRQRASLSSRRKVGSVNGYSTVVLAGVAGLRQRDFEMAALACFLKF